MDSPQLSIGRIGQLWKELKPFEWTLSFFGSKFASRRLTGWHASARISDASWTFWKISSLGGSWEQYPVGKPICSHFGSLGAFLLAKNCGKFQLFHVSKHFRATPRTRISVKIRFIWPRIMSFQYGFTTTFNLEDWSTVEGARAIWVSAVGNHRHVLCRASIFQHILAHISGQGWSFWKIPFLAGPQGQYLTGNTDFGHFGCVGWFL